MGACSLTVTIFLLLQLSLKASILDWKTLTVPSSDFSIHHDLSFPLVIKHKGNVLQMFGEDNPNKAWTKATGCKSQKKLKLKQVNKALPCLKVGKALFSVTLVGNRLTMSVQCGSRGPLRLSSNIDKCKPAGFRGVHEIRLEALEQSKLSFPGAKKVVTKHGIVSHGFTFSAAPHSFTLYKDILPLCKQESPKGPKSTRTCDCKGSNCERELKQQSINLFRAKDHTTSLRVVSSKTEFTMNTGSSFCHQKDLSCSEYINLDRCSDHDKKCQEYRNHAACSDIAKVSFLFCKCQDCPPCKTRENKKRTKKKRNKKKSRSSVKRSLTFLKELFEDPRKLADEIQRQLGTSKLINWDYDYFVVGDMGSFLYEGRAAKSLALVKDGSATKFHHYLDNIALGKCSSKCICL